MRELRVAHRADIFAVQRATRELGRELGFVPIAIGELVIVASELSSNILKYGVSGRVRLEATTHGVRGAGMRISAFDGGPPFHDFELALKDGFTDRGPLDPAAILHRGGIGAGLGAALRFSDELEWEPLPGGKRVFATRYVARHSGGHWR